MVAEESESRQEVLDYGRLIVVDSLMITLRIPYTGLQELWNMRPSTYKSIYPRANISPPRGSSHGEVILTVNKPIHNDAAQFKTEIERSIENLRFHINSVNNDIMGHNARLGGIIQDAIKTRKSKLDKHKSILAQLDLPIKPKADAPSFTPVIRRAVSSDTVTNSPASRVISGSRFHFNHDGTT